MWSGAASVPLAGQSTGNKWSWGPPPGVRASGPPSLELHRLGSQFPHCTPLASTCLSTLSVLLSGKKYYFSYYSVGIKIHYVEVLTHHLSSGHTAGALLPRERGCSETRAHYRIGRDARAPGEFSLSPPLQTKTFTEMVQFMLLKIFFFCYGPFEKSLLNLL